MVCKRSSVVALLFSCYLTRQVALGQKLQQNRHKVTQIHTLLFFSCGLVSFPLQALKQQQQRNQRRQGGMPTTSSPRLLLKTIKDMADINTKPGRSALLLCSCHSLAPFISEKNQKGFAHGLDLLQIALAACKKKILLQHSKGVLLLTNDSIINLLFYGR